MKYHSADTASLKGSKLVSGTPVGTDVQLHMALYGMTLASKSPLVLSMGFTSS